MTQCERSGFYETSDGHRLYWERHGKIGGRPIFFLHGGPGGYSSAQHLVFFDLNRFDVILFDQRGCGRSQPHGRLLHNNTSLLVDDIEALRRYFGFTGISLLGISWGSWLSLLYQNRFPESVAQITLASVFVPTKDYVSAYEQALTLCLHKMRQAPEMLTLEDLFCALHSADSQQRRAAARLWLGASLMLDGKTMDLSWCDADIDEQAIRAINLELYYHLNDYFVTAQDLDLVFRSAEPLVVLQGVRDVFGLQSLCWLRRRGSLKSRLFQVGHDAFEPIFQHAIRNAACGDLRPR
ncbi:alpha/beta fold hydrolase [Paraherbaspirillum soli]|uniref:Proline iminopeptidase n=1 Tax=Paraherbaspirillum soli TaxID=631222 RepID=A0ABW0MCV4_9BURK